MLQLTECKQVAPNADGSGWSDSAMSWFFEDENEKGKAILRNEYGLSPLIFIGSALSYITLSPLPILCIYPRSTAGMGIA